MSEAQVSAMRATIRSKAQERRISELAGLAEILRDSGYADSDLYQEIVDTWTVAIGEEIK